MWYKPTIKLINFIHKIVTNKKPQICPLSKYSILSDPCDLCVSAS